MNNDITKVYDFNEESYVYHLTEKDKQYILKERLKFIDKNDDAKNIDWAKWNEITARGRNEVLNPKNFHNSYNKKVNERKGKPILQYDLKGNLIRRFDKVKDVAQFGYGVASVSACLRGLQNFYKNSVWIYDI